MQTFARHKRHLRLHQYLRFRRLRCLCLPRHHHHYHLNHQSRRLLLHHHLPHVLRRQSTLIQHHHCHRYCQSLPIPRHLHRHRLRRLAG